jgi:hypothetical protein
MATRKKKVLSVQILREHHPRLIARVERVQVAVGDATPTKTLAAAAAIGLSVMEREAGIGSGQAKHHS